MNRSDAANGEDFSDRVRALGFDARVLSGDEEAQLMFLGAMTGRADAADPLLARFAAYAGIDKDKFDRADKSRTPATSADLSLAKAAAGNVPMAQPRETLAPRQPAKRRCTPRSIGVTSSCLNRSERCFDGSQYSSEISLWRRR